MELVKQDGHPKACLLACIAMVEGVSLREVVRIAGSDQPPTYEARERLSNYFNREWVYHSKSYPIENYSNNCLAAMMREHSTLIGTVSSCIDPNFAHCVVIHDRKLYDPYAGINPEWPWDRTVMRVHLIPPKKEQDQ